MTLRLASGLLAMGVLLGARQACALGLELGADVGYGAPPFADDYTPNRFGFGFGAHGGVEISHVYIGATYHYFLGGTLLAPAVGAPQLPSMPDSVHTMQLGAQLGYAISVGRLTVRPYLWGGPTIYSVAMASSESPDVRMTLAPGAFARFRIAGPAFVGADAKCAVIFGGNNEPLRAQLTAFGTVGVAFSL